MAKCSECGFLANTKKDTRKLEEVEKVLRDTGDYIRSEYYNIYGYPICFMQKYDIEAEAGEHSLNSEVILGVLQKERDCKAFTEWHQGSAPKEHQEMIDRERRDKFEADIRKNDKRWHIAEIILIVVLSGFFTLLGAFISQGGH